MANDGLPGYGAVHFENVPGLVSDVHHLRRALLHPEGHLEGVDPRGDLGVADLLEPHPVERLHGIQGIALERFVEPAGIGQIKHRIAAGAELHALVDRRQESAAPVRIAAAGPFLAGAEKTTKPGRSCDSLPSP